VEAGLQNDVDTNSSTVPLILVGLGAGLAGAALVARRRQLAAAVRRR
jgi:LPXTG-motif cell wall-anchored protein